MSSNRDPCTPSFQLIQGKRLNAGAHKNNVSSAFSPRLATPNRIILRRRPSSSHSSQSQSPVTVPRAQPSTNPTTASSDSAFFSDGTTSNSLSSTITGKKATGSALQSSSAQVRFQNAIVGIDRILVDLSDTIDQESYIATAFTCSIDVIVVVDFLVLAYVFRRSSTDQFSILVLISLVVIHFTFEQSEFSYLATNDSLQSSIEYVHCEFVIVEQRQRKYE